jgi:hypothetical protein
MNKLSYKKTCEVLDSFVANTRGVNLAGLYSYILIQAHGEDTGNEQ